MDVKRITLTDDIDTAHAALALETWGEDNEMGDYTAADLRAFVADENETANAFYRSQSPDDIVNATLYSYKRR